MLSKRRILCIHDHVDICDLVRSLLGDYEVVLAHSKTDGLRKLENELFDLYLLQDLLSDGTGVELATFIRQFDGVTPILITSSSYAFTVRQVSDSGAQGLISEDNLVDDLLRKVSRLLS